MVAAPASAADPVPALTLHLVGDRLTMQLSLDPPTQDFEFFTFVIPPDSSGGGPGPFLAAGQSFAESTVLVHGCGTATVLVSRRPVGSFEKGVFVAQQEIQVNCRAYLPLLVGPTLRN